VELVVRVEFTFGSILAGERRGYFGVKLGVAVDSLILGTCGICHLWCESGRMGAGPSGTTFSPIDQ
jgi:hypothetical protein